MAQLQALDGRPLTWEELRLRLKWYYSRALDLTEAPTTYYESVPANRRSRSCNGQAHAECDSFRYKGGELACECECGHVGRS